MSLCSVRVLQGEREGPQVTHLRLKHKHPAVPDPALVGEFPTLESPHMQAGPPGASAALCLHDACQSVLFVYAQVLASSGMVSGLDPSMSTTDLQGQAYWLILSQRDNIQGGGCQLW